MYPTVTEFPLNLQGLKSHVREVYHYEQRQTAAHSWNAVSLIWILEANNLFMSMEPIGFHPVKSYFSASSILYC